MTTQDPDQPTDEELAPKLLTVEELASELKVKKSWIYGQTRKKGEGSIPGFKVGKYWRFFFAGSA